MRRKIQQTPNFDWTQYSVHDDVDKEQLQLIGAVCLQWNYIEDMIDWALFHVWEIDRTAAIETSSRINGLEGKFAIIKRCVRVVKRHPKPIPTMIDATIDTVAEHKRFRDGVIHARLLDPKSDTAPTGFNRGRADEILLSKDALRNLSIRLDVISDEIWAAMQALAYTFIDDNDNYDTRAMQASEHFQSYIAQLQEHQKHRKALPPLPQFPQKFPTHPASEEPK